MNGNSFRVFRGSSSISEYNILNQVGEGTFGEVHKAELKSTGELVALKRLRVENEKEGFPITAIREVKLLKQLNHENVIGLLDMAIKKNNNSLSPTTEIFMVFPYLEHDLRGILDSPGIHISMGQIKSYVQQLFQGLDYLHSNNILHRDLKCANLLISNKGILKIGDFGLARPYEPDSLGPLTNLVVTRWYRPPELLLGCTKYTSAIDLWGAGCILAEMIKRKAMFPGSSDLDQLNCIFKICGSPTHDTWPNWREYSRSENFLQSTRTYTRCLTTTLKSIFEANKQIPDKLMINLLDQILVLAPEKRPSAKEILKDPWFISDPLPLKPANIPALKYDCHEYEVRKSREMKQRIQTSYPPTNATTSTHPTSTSSASSFSCSSSSISTTTLHHPLPPPPPTLPPFPPTNGFPKPTPTYPPHPHAHSYLPPPPLPPHPSYFHPPPSLPLPPPLHPPPHHYLNRDPPRERERDRDRDRERDRDRDKDRVRDRDRPRSNGNPLPSNKDRTGKHHLGNRHHSNGAG